MKNPTGKSKKYDLIIIGAGAAGLFAACAAGEKQSILIIEKNPIPGKKLSITGGGRCNILNATFDTNTLLEKFPESKKFLYSTFAQFGVKDTYDYFEKTLDLPLDIQANARTFPRTQKATDVRNAMMRHIQKKNVEILYETAITDIAVDADHITHITCKSLGSHREKTNTHQTFTAKKYILATGGLAAPETGSTGDGFKLLEKIGHTVKKPSPNIVPLTTDEKWIHRASGTKLSDVRITFSAGDQKKKIRGDGDILLTHFGITGPTVLNLSKKVSALLYEKDVTARLDLFPNVDEGELDKKILTLFEGKKNKQARNVLPEILPKNLAKEIFSFPEVDITDEKVHELPKEKRKALVRTLKNLTFPITGTCSFDKAVIADGGVIPEEVNFKTMQSRKFSNLHLIGDTLSINRPSGGYSLQLCWTTAYVATNNNNSSS